jgi:hypothetical protein
LVFQIQSQSKNPLSLRSNGVEAAGGTGVDGVVVDGAIAAGGTVDGAAAGTVDAVGMEAGGGAQALASWSAAVSL